MRRLLEVIACSVEDAIAAEDGGAGRIELVRDLEAGGLTPALELVRRVLERVSIPVRVMIRESRGFTIVSDAERERLFQSAGEIAALSPGGIVLGFAAAGALDVRTTAEVLSRAPALKATFHHAYDAAGDSFAAMAQLKSLPMIDRVLTSAPRTPWAELIEAANPKLTIVAGGGMTEERIRRIAREAPVMEFHAGRAAREPRTSEGRVSAIRVHQLIRALQ